MSDVARRVRSQRRVWAMPGSGHDRVVRLALLTLPAGIAVLGAFLVFSPLVLGGDVSFVLDKNKVDMAQERLRIQSAQYRGSDGKDRPFELDAGSAVQKSSAEPIVQLNQLKAHIQLADGPAQFRADRGRYDMSSDRVAIDGPVHFQAPDGYHLNTSNATFDLRTSQMTSSDAAEGTTPLGTFSADAMRADLEKRTVNLDGNVRLRIVPKQANRRQ